MHSMQKLSENYPNIDMKQIKELYGQGRARNQREYWNKLVIQQINKVNIITGSRSL